MYKVIDIIEPDFGCEGLPDGQELCCEVLLENQESGERITVKVPDALLYEKEIVADCFVTYENGSIEKAEDASSES